MRVALTSVANTLNILKAVITKQPTGWPSCRPLREVGARLPDVRMREIKTA